MIYSGHNLKYAAISFDTLLFGDLSWFMNELNIELLRVDPYEFLSTATPDQELSVINLVTRDKHLRKEISNHIDLIQQSRFSYSHHTNLLMDKLGAGVFLNAFCGVSTNAVINNDVILQAHNIIGHNSVIGKGSILDLRVAICGSAVIGEFCHLHSESVIYDNISITDDVVISANSKVRKNIFESGTYASVVRSEFKKIS